MMRGISLTLTVALLLSQFLPSAYAEEGGTPTSPSSPETTALVT